MIYNHSIFRFKYILYKYHIRVLSDKNILVKKEKNVTIKSILKISLIKKNNGTVISVFVVEIF